jgi:hypothetical protein
VDPRAGLDAVAKKDILSPCRGSNPGHPARIQALYRLRYFEPFLATHIHVSMVCMVMLCVAMFQRLGIIGTVLARYFVLHVRVCRVAFRNTVYTVIFFNFVRG